MTEKQIYWKNINDSRKVKRQKYYKKHKERYAEISKKNRKNKYKQRKIWYNKHPWMKSFYHAKRRCNDKKDIGYFSYGAKGIKFLLSKEEIKTLWFRDKAYLMKKPSIDRKDSTKDYIFDNCQFIELVENTRKATSKKILQYDLNGKFIREWKSATKAAKYIKCAVENINMAARNLTKTAKGFIWKRKLDIN